MIEAFCKHISPAMIFNWDATQYALSPDKDEICVYQKGKDFGPLTSESGGGSFLSIKHYHFHNANGTVAPPVFVIADDLMDPEAFIWDEHRREWKSFDLLLFPITGDERPHRRTVRIL